MWHLAITIEFWLSKPLWARYLKKHSNAEYLKPFALLELTFSAIAKLNFYIKQHTSLIISRVWLLVCPLYMWGLETNLTLHTECSTLCVQNYSLMFR